MISQRKRLFDQVARLRRAERAMPGNRDVASVRAELERELGDTVSLRLAGEILGVSHTAIRRWVNRGDIPLVHTREGLVRLPVAAVLDLHETVERERDAGRRHVLEPGMLEAHRRARQIPSAKATRSDDHHDRAAERSLAYHRAIARRLRRPMRCIRCGAGGRRGRSTLATPENGRSSWHGRWPRSSEPSARIRSGPGISGRARRSRGC